MKRILNYFKNPKKRSVLNGILLLIAISFNTYAQVFCIPVNWAIIVLTICLTNSILFPVLIKKKRFIPMVSFINGISFCVFIYCVIFLEQMNYLGLMLILALGLGLVTFIPHFFAIQILWKGFIKQSSKIGRGFFVLGVCISILIAIISSWKYQEAIVDLKNFENSVYQELNKTFMTERILGIGIIYHTAFCEFDGWRPPKHDPILNIGHWLNGRKDPVNLSLENRVVYYKKFFPDKKVKFNCSCAYSYSQLYHNDEIWK